MFSNGSSSSISLATVTPSLVMRGEPNFLSITTLRPAGPSVLLTAFGNLFHAAEQSLAGGFVKLDLFSHNIRVILK